MLDQLPKSDSLTSAPTTTEAAPVRRGWWGGFVGVLVVVGAVVSWVATFGGDVSKLGGASYPNNFVRH